jgi:hypothetical protein
MAEGAISSRFSILHSSKNSRIGDGCDPTEMYAISARFFNRPIAPPYKIGKENENSQFQSSPI